ncbi:hypothetical protein ASPVEDRAFT_29630 [Aspergillus versicolor CBS 583.65]|uniref:HMA domain-containing protein n=1 Tax=Aspergillus versicolor CBS 583.65 TaxID=1036611 RepID=A0A1L9PNS5_ASPVE|nr:uncharacterized protein ASPVEDRAFT_29630 [Aspergillus versicolor CBS 583.65]OJJ03096.1 hypothetical protein ASPVEDRAFT_29630 [Aspergillus versicolor CBS 583.65]
MTCQGGSRSSACCGGESKDIKPRDECVPQAPGQGQVSCCTTEKPQEEDPNEPSCCKDKPSPCCDMSCVDRIALRECDKRQIPSPTSASSSLPSSGCRSADGNPCDQHRRSARAKYAAKLDALGCICRALIALGQESCCVPPRLNSLRQQRRSGESSRGILQSARDSCCEGGSSGAEKRCSGSPEGKRKSISTSCLSAPEVPVASKQCSSGCCSMPETSATHLQDCGTSNVTQSLTTSQRLSSGKETSEASASPDGCCSKSLRPTGAFPPEKPCSSGCCSTPRAPTGDCPGKSPKSTDTCPGGCCSKPALPACGITEEKSSDSIEVIPTAIPDLEKGIMSQEHIVLSISGMTCTGCETKLKRNLGALNSVQNLKTSLVLSRAEFDLNVGIQSLEEVFKHLEKTTEFKYERVTDRGSRVDIVVPNASEFMKQDWPRGVTEMALIDERTVNVAFDATKIGARDLVQQGWDRPLSLAAPRHDPALAAGNKHVRHVGYMTILSIILTVPVLVLAWAPLPEREIAYGSASLALATVVQVIIAGPFYPKALKALIFSRIIEMDLLIVLSTSAAYIFSVVSFGYLVAGRPLATGGFFETSTLLVTLIMVGRYVAALARQKAVESVSLRTLQTPTAILVNDSENVQNVDVRLLQYGDLFKVIPDSKIPTDGTVFEGSSEVDESMITGESIPVDKFPGSPVLAGSMNGSGTLTVKLTRLPADNTISIIADMVDQAKLSKPKIQDMADRVASYFVPVVVTLTIITFVIWIAIGVAVRNQSGSRATTEAITYAITVLIVSCPCAIGLAVPMVIVIASGVAAERGVIFKTADSIEVAYKTSHVVFDKTGTLTRGKLTVAAEHIDSTNDSMSLLLGLIGSNKHPISAAVAAHLKDKGISASTITNTKVLTGRGVEGSAPGLTVRAGNSRWLDLSSNPQVQSVLEQGYTAFCFTVNDALAAVFGLEDSLRPDALETITKLQQRGISVHLLSGDDDSPVRSIARQLSIPDQNIRSRCTPADKQAYIQALATSSHQQPRRTKATIIFIGDGTNDAIALASSTIGVHMNQETGSDVAKSAADVVLMRPSLLSVLTMITISEKAVRRIKFNFCWSFVYNLFAVLLGAGAFVNARIPPEFAGLGELVSVLPVVVAAVLLRWLRV